ncbi:MAG: CIS tube protein [Planctomycetota bacterium]
MPGSDSPIQQFVRGGLRTLTMEVYFNNDFYDGAWDVRESVRNLEALAEKTDDTLAPPVCLFEWGEFQMPVVVGSVTTRYTMFDPSGVPIEATVALSLRAYHETGPELDVTRHEAPVRKAKRPPACSGRDGSGSVFAPAEEEGLAAADALATAGNPTTEVITEGESLRSVSTRKYGTPKLWRALAAANSGLDKVRELKEGAELLVPDPRHPLGIIERVTAIPEESLSALRQAQKIGMEGAERALLPSPGVTVT